LTRPVLLRAGLSFFRPCRYAPKRKARDCASNAFERTS
jgi:hypothetical protein